MMKKTARALRSVVFSICVFLDWPLSSLDEKWKCKHDKIRQNPKSLSGRCRRNMKGIIVHGSWICKNRIFYWNSPWPRFLIHVPTGLRRGHLVKYSDKMRHLTLFYATPNTSSCNTDRFCWFPPFPFYFELWTKSVPQWIDPGGGSYTSSEGTENRNMKFIFWKV